MRRKIRLREECPAGFIRNYYDHTGRWYRDVAPYTARQRFRRSEKSNRPNAVLARMLAEEIRKEIDAEIIRSFLSEDKNGTTKES